MRAARSMMASVAAAGLALSLVAAEPATDQETAGQASTQMLGADATVTSLGEEVTGRLLDIVTEATTIDAPAASSSVVPLALAGQTAGEASASSDGRTSADSGGGQLGDVAGLLGLSASPFQTRAEATADTAIATVDAVTAQLGGLFEVLGMQMDTPGITSQVTPDGADATQGLTVTGLDLGLGDLGLGADVLGQLGLSQVLDLLSALDLADGLPDGVPGEIAQVEDLQGQLTDALGGIGGLESSITDTLDELSALNTQVADLQSQIAELEDLQGQLEDLDSGGGLGGLFGGLTGLLDQLTGDAADLLQSLDCVSEPDDALACVQGTISDLQDALPAVGEVTGLLDTLTSDLGDLEALLGTVTGIVQDLLDELGGLQGLLDTLLAALPDLLDDAAATDLLSIGAFDVGMNAVAKDTVEDSSATVLCAPTQIAVLGQVTSTPDCSEGLSAVSDVTGTISGALGSLTDLLNTLPLGDAVQAGDLKLELFGNLVEEVEEVDGVVTATAGFDVLDLQLPSISLDPSAVTGPLGDLGALPSELDQLTGLLGDLPSALELGALDSLGGVDLGPVTDALGSLDSTGTLTGLVGQVETLLGGLDAGNLGSLGEAVATPGLSLVIDPVSTASFEADPAPAAPAPDEDPAAAPDEDPALPTTGGGLALAAMMALGGAAMLGRRRRD